MTFMEIANSRFVYIVAMGVILVILVMCLVYLRIALKRAKEIGIESYQLRTAVRTTVLVSVGPMISILAPFLAFMALVGAPWAWLRLSVIGSAGMEMLYANMIMDAAGYDALGVETNADAFCLITLAIGVCCCSAMLMNLFFNKSYLTTLEKAKTGKNSEVISAVIAALYMGIVLNMDVTYLTTYIGTGMWTPIASMATAFVIAIVGDICIEKYEMKKLQQYSFAIYLVAGMCSAIVWDKIF